MQSHTHKVHVFLAVTCHLHFWQNDWDLLHSTAVTQLNLTLSLPWCHLKATSKRVKFQILRHFSFLFYVTRERVGIKTHRSESTFVIGPGKYTVCRRVRVLFNLEISQAWAVKGLSWLSRVSAFALRHCLSLFQRWCCSYCSLVDLEGFFSFLLQLEDSLWEGLTDSYVKLPMALTAENLAEQYKLSRQDCDDYALQTQTRWQEGTWDMHGFLHCKFPCISLSSPTSHPTPNKENKQFANK